MSEKVEAWLTYTRARTDSGTDGTSGTVRGDGQQVDWGAMHGGGRCMVGGVSLAVRGVCDD
jgi:hypothetical protein